ELMEEATRVPELVDHFERLATIRQWMSRAPVPCLMHTLGRGGRGLASVEEDLSGPRIAGVLRAGAPGRRMPVEIAFAIGRALISTWIAAEAASPPVRVNLSSAAVQIEVSGRVRVIPEYAEEHARQAVGAAIGVIMAPISYMAPEQM